MGRRTKNGELWCGCCSTWKPKDSFWNGSKGGKQSECKDCLKLARKNDRPNRIDFAQRPEWKVHPTAEIFLYGRVVTEPPKPLPDGKACSKCSKLKPLEDFNRCLKGKYGRHAACKECSSKKDRKYLDRQKELYQLKKRRAA